VTRNPPQHGERRCYLRGCQRAECRAAHLQYCKQGDLRRHRGNRRRVDGAQAAEHLRTILANDWTQSGIATVTGLAASTIQGLVCGDNKYCTPEDRDRILAFNPGPDDECPGYWTDPTSTIRRLRALAAIGHSLNACAEELGLSYAALRCITRGERAKVSRNLARRVVDLYATWGRKSGPSVVARGMALSKGWHGPLAWDDIDDPAAQPDPAAPYQPIPKNGRDSLRRAEIAHLLSLGESVASIARQMNANEKYINDLISEGLTEPTYEAVA
jgi:hypothetical protein